MKYKCKSARGEGAEYTKTNSTDTENNLVRLAKLSALRSGRANFFFKKRTQPFLWVSSVDAYLKISVNGLPNRLTFCVIFKVYKYTENVAAGA
jgi:hypothetical protein